MMKCGKRILSVLLVLLMMVCAVPAAHGAAVIASGTDGNISWRLDSEGVLTISGTGSMRDYYELSSVTSAPWGGQYCSKIKTVVIEDGVTSIGVGAFYGCNSLTNVTIPDSVTSIGDGAFVFCMSLTKISVNENNLKYASDNYGCLYNKRKTELIQYPCGDSRISFSIPNGVVSIKNHAFSYSLYLTSVTIPESVTSIEEGAYFECISLTDIYYYGTEAQWNSISIEENNEELTDARIHFNGNNSENNIYNMGEETYSFDNYKDNHSDGHCFGMSVTSSMYYLGLLDQSILGDSSKKLFEFRDTLIVRDPICYYQRIQGSYSRNAIVAGGYYYKSNELMRLFGTAHDIQSDWNEVINYVRNHDHDNKGALQIGYRGKYINKKGKIVEGGHAINFLRYAVVDGQERIYAYDNNFPDLETYFYKEVNGKIYQAPLASFSKEITCIALRDVKKYYEFAQNYKKSFAVYATQDFINIENSVQSIMDGDYETNSIVMYELPDDLTEVTITPLVDNATFTYMDQTYTFGEIDGDTYGVLTLSATEDGTGALVIENAPATDPGTPDDPQQDNLCPWCGSVHEGFFQGIIGFFHGIFAKIFGAKY